uniref:metallophosphoesterase n=1 Tax=Escherichia coli TaxID=562 RepID=UPI0015C4BCD8
VQFSDTHLGFQLDFDYFEKIIQRISKEEPDLIIFSGDLVDNLLSFYEYEEIIIYLNYLQAPYGKFAVYGNHDHGGWGTDK